MANSRQAEDDQKHVRTSELPEVRTHVQSADVPLIPGKAGEALCTIPSFAAASALLSAPYSCLVMNTHRRHIALPAMYLNKKKTGIKLELDAELLKFSQSMKGVPLAYDSTRILGQYGDIYDDSGYIHMDIEANFIVFRPKKGRKLLGTVNKLGVNHVGCLVHGCFNASILKPNLVSVETWRDAGPRVGAALEFEVTALDADTAGVLLIRGRLEGTRVQELMALAESSECGIPADQPDAPGTEPTPEPTEGSSDKTPKKKQKKKKDKVKEEETEEEVMPSYLQDGNTTLELNGNIVSEKKQKKKEKRLKEEVELSPLEVHGSDSSGYISDKPSKKRKHESGSDVTSGFREDLDLPKPKKKKKSDIEKFA
uniref:DNA-directed RNA polymerase I subunit RPA43 n=1 Tax=Monopterus albus TaxID=43700 RepID=UPI0009B32222|nr:DNA-directed RNA polymerase I subunit RPA43 [Monopterus albus]